MRKPKQKFNEVAAVKAENMDIKYAAGPSQMESMSSAPCVDGLPLAVSGKVIKLASVHDEIWREGFHIANPEQFVARLREHYPTPDIFNFAEQFPQTKASFQYYHEWDNFAVIPVVSYADWWEKRLPQESRRNVRLAAKRGVSVELVEFDDELVHGITGIYNETPIRQGRSFIHFGKKFETVKNENGTYLDRSQFIAAYCGDELIGFAKVVFIDKAGSIMQILSKNAHLDKKPMNALLAKAVEVCEQRGLGHLIYRKFTYGKVFSPLTEFKRRNGFEEMRYPRYYIPLTWKGKVAMKFGFHLGLRDSLPPALVSKLISLRGKCGEIFGKKLSSVSSP